MRVFVVAIGAVLLTGLMAVYQMPTLLEGLPGGTETVAGVSTLPDVSSAPPENAAAGADQLDPAEASANAATDAGLAGRFEDGVARSESPDEAEHVADAVRVKQLRASLVNRSSRNRSRAAEELGEAGDRYSIPALESLARRDPSSNVRLAAVEALGDLDATGALADIVSDPDASDDTKIEAIEEVVDTNEDLDFDSMTTGALLRALDDPNSDVYEAAAEMLWGVDDPSVNAAVWSQFERYAQIDFERAEVMLDLLESLDQEVDEARELLDYYDPTDWDAVVRERQREAWANGVCYAGLLCS